MNTRLHGEKMLFWADGYSQKHRQEKHDWLLTIHFSIKFQAYVEDDNDLPIENNIVKDTSFNGGIYGTSDVFVDAGTIFGERACK